MYLDKKVFNYFILNSQYNLYNDKILRLFNFFEILKTEIIVNEFEN